jgi:endonuclease/exonuclease/phosphatase family metal-dependent hydrolase
MRVLSWNLFHGRDHPPNAELFTLRSRLLRIAESDGTYAQVNRPLLREFAGVIAREEWDVAFLQEASPRWLVPLARESRASAASALTSRNLGAFVRAALAELNPDLIASGEGGSNQLLVRPPWRIAEVRRFTLTHYPERRRMLWARLEEPGGAVLAVANLHATAGDPAAAAIEVEWAAERAVDLAGEAPLVFGGDLNLRPKRSPVIFERLERRLGLAAPTDADAIDHLLARGLDVEERPHRLPASWHEVACGDGPLRLRLSDHAAVAARFKVR